MKRFKIALLTLLTTLFVTFMTVTPSYAQNGVAPQGDCTTVEMVLDADVVAQVTKARGSIEHVTDIKMVGTFLKNFEEKGGSAVPFPVSSILIVVPAEDYPYANVAVFDNNCLQGMTRVPAFMVDELLGRKQAQKS